MSEGTISCEKLNLTKQQQVAGTENHEHELTPVSDEPVPETEKCEPTGAISISKRALKKLARIQKWKQQKKKPKSKKENASEPGFGADLYRETEYYYENGLRKVYPYYYTFTTYVKQRWIGRTILDVFSSEFKAYSAEDYKSAIEKGNVTADGSKVSCDFVLKDNVLLAHTLHRHENPVIGCPIEVIAHTEDLIVINKPCSIPCHPCGKYRHNSIVFILGRQLGCANLRNIYRLDRLTSGVLILGKTTEGTKVLEDQVLKRQVQKEYVCRVVGDFPHGKIECREPLGVISPKLGLFRVRSDGKQSHTTFQRISYNGKSSVVKCTPHTGRTHQIRVHLQYLGYPIINDPFYNSEAWGPSRNKGGVMDRTDQQVSDRLLELHNIGHWTNGENPLFTERLKEIEDSKVKLTSLSPHPETTESSPDAVDDGESMSEDKDLGNDRKPATCTQSLTKTAESNPDRNSSWEHQAKEDLSGSPPVKKSRLENDLHSKRIQDFDRNKWIPDPVCHSCRMRYVDPKPEDLVMYLHALRYAGPGWEYSTPMPEWAKEEWTQD